MGVDGAFSPSLCYLPEHPGSQPFPWLLSCDPSESHPARSHGLAWSPRSTSGGPRLPYLLPAIRTESDACIQDAPGASAVTQMGLGIPSGRCRKGRVVRATVAARAWPTAHVGVSSAPTADQHRSLTSSPCSPASAPPAWQPCPPPRPRTRLPRRGHSLPPPPPGPPCSIPVLPAWLLVLDCAPRASSPVACFCGRPVTLDQTFCASAAESVHFCSGRPLV